MHKFFSKYIPYAVSIFFSIKNMASTHLQYFYREFKKIIINLLESHVAILKRDPCHRLIHDRIIYRQPWKKMSKKSKYILYKNCK